MKKRLCLIIAVFFASVIFAASAYAEKLIYAATADGEMMLSLSPGEDSPGIVHIPACAQMSLIETKGTWGLVNFQNKCGWINLSFTRETYDSAAEATGIECAKNVKIKSKDKNVILYNLPSDKEAFGSKEKYTVPVGMIVKITRETPNGWGLVNISDEYAWVKLENTKPYKTSAEQSATPYEIYYVYVLTEGEGALNMYAEPGKGSVLAMIPDCTKLTVRETKDNYAYVSYAGINGWINLKYTTTSFYYARSNAGNVVNEEFVTVLPDSGEEIPVYRIPYAEEISGNEELGRIDGEMQIFVQRMTHDGWQLINHNGLLGWIPPGSAVKKQDEDSEDITIIENAEEKYMTTEKGKGVPIYADYYKESDAFTVPEYIKVKTLAQKDGRVYVYSDYMSGWTDSENLYNSYNEALEVAVLEESLTYHALTDTILTDIPAKPDVYGSKKLCTIKENTVFEIRKFVTAGKGKWALVEVAGKRGFVSLADVKKGIPSNKKLYAVYITAGMILLILSGILTVYAIRKNKINKFSENS